MTDWLKHNTRFMILAAAIALAAGLVFWLGATPPSDILRFAAYEIIFVLLPGCLVYRALRPTQPPIRQIAFGWAIGYTLEILAFCLTAILNLRPLFAFYPLLLIGFSLLRSRPNPQYLIPNPKKLALGTPHVALAALIVLSLAYLGLSYFSETPLQFEAVTHHPDLIWQIGNAAEALRHVPLTDPRVAGEPLNYHNFVYYHMAAIAQVTGIELATILFRLYLVPMFIALGLQLYVLGVWASGKAWAGPLAVALFFFFGELGWQNTTANPYAFLNTLFTILWLSPTYTLGLVIFIPLMVEAFKNQDVRTKNQEPSAKNTEERKKRDSRKFFSSFIPHSSSFILHPLSFILLLLLIGSEGAKAATLPVMLGGLGLYLGLEAVFRRRIHWHGVGVFGLTLLVLGLFFALVYRNSEAVSGFRPFNSVLAMPALQPLWPMLSDLPRLVRWAVTVIMIPIGAFAHMPLHWLGLGLAVATQRKAILSALIAPDPTKHLDRQIYLFCIFATGMGAFLLLSYSNLAQTYFILYAYPAACALAATGLANIFSTPRKLTALPALALALIAVWAAADFPIDNAPKFMRWLRGETTYSQEDRALTAELLAGLRWVRGNTDPDAILAVNNQRLLQRFPGNGYYWYYSAYSQRRVFLEGWVYTDRARRLGYTRVQDEAFHPFAERATLNRRVFEQADPAALATLVRDFGVGYLLVDKQHGTASPELGKLGRVVFENTALVVYNIH